MSGLWASPPCGDHESALGLCWIIVVIATAATTRRGGWPVRRVGVLVLACVPCYIAAAAEAAIMYNAVSGVVCCVVRGSVFMCYI